MEDEFSQVSKEDSGSRFANSPSQTEKEAEDGVEVPFEQLSPETITQLIESFVLREGTDYGEHEALLPRKIEDVRRQLQKGEVKIVFDLISESCSLVPAKKHRQT